MGDIDGDGDVGDIGKDIQTFEYLVKNLIQ